jgi:hypothetical protein
MFNKDLPITDRLYINSLTGLIISVMPKNMTINEVVNKSIVNKPHIDIVRSANGATAHTNNVYEVVYNIYNMELQGSTEIYDIIVYILQCAVYFTGVDINVAIKELNSLRKAIVSKYIL